MWNTIIQVAHVQYLRASKQGESEMGSGDAGPWVQWGGEAAQEQPRWG